MKALWISKNHNLCSVKTTSKYQAIITNILKKSVFLLKVTTSVKIVCKWRNNLNTDFEKKRKSFGDLIMQNQYGHFCAISSADVKQIWKKRKWKREKELFLIVCVTKMGN